MVSFMRTIVRMAWEIYVVAIRSAKQTNDAQQPLTGSELKGVSFGSAV